MEDEKRADEPVALFGANLRRFRKAFGWNQSELARHMQDAGWPKYSQVAVARTEEGSRAVRLDEAIALAKLFKRKLQDLLDPAEVIDSWQRLRFLMDDHSMSVTELREAVDVFEQSYARLKHSTEDLRAEIGDAGGHLVSETMVKTLENADRMLARDAEDIVAGHLDALRGDLDGEHQAEA